MGLDNPLHLLILGLVLLLVFGAKRLPEIGRSLGEGMRGFKDSLSGEHRDAITPAPPAPTAPPPAPPPRPPPPPRPGTGKRRSPPPPARSAPPPPRRFPPSARGCGCALV